MILFECEGYLAFAEEAKKRSLDLHEIFVVKEFLDVFHDEFSGLPPNKEIKFTIDFVLET